MVHRDRKLFRCTFQVEANTRLGKLLHFLLASREDDSVRTLLHETLELHWMPIHLVNQYKSGLLTDEEYRQQVLLAVSRLQSWSIYCQRVTAVGPVSVDAHTAAFPSSDAESKALLTDFASPSQEVDSVKFDEPVVVDDSLVSDGSAAPPAPLVDMPKLPFAGRRSQSMKPAFGGAFSQDDDD